MKTALNRRDFLQAVIFVGAGSFLAACGTAQTSATATTSASSPSTQSGQSSQNGQPPAAPPGAAGGDTAGKASTASAVYTLDGGTASKDGVTLSATKADQSAVDVINGGKLTLANATLTSSGNSSSNDNSSFFGLNAAVLAESASTISLSDSTVTTSGSGANAVFATGQSSTITLSKVKIKATGGGGHGVMATQGGALVLQDVDIETSGANSAPLATDRGGGTITATGGTVTCSGQDSPCLYSTGVLHLSGGSYTASGAEAAVIEGANSILLADTALSSSKEKWGVMIYQSMSGDAQGAKGTFTMSGGSLAYTAASGPLFYVTNSTGVITLKGVKVTAKSGLLIKAASGAWGSSGANGGTVDFSADGQTLSGDVSADAISTVSLALQNGSELTGAINTDRSARAASLSLDSSSTWNVTGDSHLSGLTLSGGINGTTVANINGNSHTVTYESGASAALGGKTYTLTGGGTLKPA